MRVMAATNGESKLRQNRLIFGRAVSSATAISWPDMFPEVKTNSRTACRCSARFSSKL